ncbi:MAG: hypothetical protein QW331_02215 [Candidatus Woesearchaeota archaeon]
MMQKRGQVTIYIIFGIVIAIIIGFILYALTYVKASVPQQDLPTAFKSYVEDCIQKTAADGLYRMGQYTADMDLHSEFIQNPYFNTNYALLKEKSDLIALEPDARIKLEKHIASNVDKCIDYELFIDRGAEFSFSGEPSASVVFGKSDVTIMWKKEIILNEKKGTSIKFPFFETKLYLPIKLVYDEAKEAVSLANEDDYDLTQLREFDGNVFGTRFNDGAVVVEQPHEAREKQPFLFVYGLD